MKQNTSYWHQACSIHDLDGEEPLSLMIGSMAVAIYQIGSTYYARENICPHAYAVLTDGFYDEGIIECPIHQGGPLVRHYIGRLHKWTCAERFEKI